MARVINMPGMAVSSYLYGDTSHQVATYLNNQLRQLPESVANVGNFIYDSAVKAYNYVTDTTRRLVLDNVLESVGLRKKGDYIAVYDTYEQYQQAPITMQRWLMANPTIAELNNNNQICGYQDTYIQEDGIGTDNYDYRRVTDGVLMQHPDGFYGVYNYIEELREGDRDLTLSEQSRILRSWEITNMFAELKMDFTSSEVDARIRD